MQCHATIKRDSINLEYHDKSEIIQWDKNLSY